MLFSTIAVELRLSWILIDVITQYLAGVAFVGNISDHRPPTRKVDSIPPELFIAIAVPDVSVHIVVIQDLFKS